MPRNYDVIVLGTGGVGSAALYHLARRGVQVLGLDRFPPGHNRGSSHGQTRVIRQAYFEHSDYVPLLKRAYECWHALEQESGRKLYHQTGLLEVGPPGGLVIGGVLRSAAEHDLRVEELSRDEIQARWPKLTVPSELTGVFEQDAGFLQVESCVHTHVQQAIVAGAELHIGPAVVDWQAAGSGVTVRTAEETYHAQRLVITAGAWSAGLLSDLQGYNVPLHVLKKPLYWFPTQENAYRLEQGFPVFFFEMPSGFFYGFPQLDSGGIKLARHSGGTTVADPLQVDRGLDAEDLAQVEGFLRDVFPDIQGPPTRRETCLYTMTPDENFLVDRHPAHEQVVFAAGLSGHGFKFCGVLGEALADLTMEGRTELPIGFLGLERFRHSDA